jgi:hypothetical protein
MLFPAFGWDTQGKSLFMMREKSRFESKTTPAASRRIRPQVDAGRKIPICRFRAIRVSAPPPLPQGESGQRDQIDQQPQNDVE